MDPATPRAKGRGWFSNHSGWPPSRLTKPVLISRGRGWPSHIIKNSRPSKVSFETIHFSHLSTKGREKVNNYGCLEKQKGERSWCVNYLLHEMMIWMCAFQVLNPRQLFCNHSTHLCLLAFRFCA